MCKVFERNEIGLDLEFTVRAFSLSGEGLRRVLCQVLRRNVTGNDGKNTVLFGENVGFGLDPGTEVAALDEQAEDVLEGEVGLLDVHGGGGGDGDEVVGEGAHVTAVVAGEADGVDGVGAAVLKGAEDVGGVAGGGDAEEDVAGGAEGFELAGEDAVEAEVVAGGGEDGGIGGEGDGAEGGAVDGEADDELGDEVLGVGGGATVAGDEELAAGLEGGGGEFGDGDEGVVEVLVGEDSLQGGDGVCELCVDDVLHG